MIYSSPFDDGVLLCGKGKDSFLGMYRREGANGFNVGDDDDDGDGKRNRKSWDSFVLIFSEPAFPSVSFLEFFVLVKRTI